MLGAKIADGRTAEIYEWADGQVVKLLRSDFDHRGLDHEADILRRLNKLRLPMPKLIDAVEVDGRPGLVFERVDGGPISVRPWNLRATGRMLADLHSALHRRKAAGRRAGLPSLVERMRREIEAAAPPSIAARALDRLASLPDGDRICHNDVHPGNVLQTRAGPVLIDWADAACGHPAADVARAVLLLKIGDRPRGARGRVEDVGRTLLTRTYLNAYPTPLPRPWLLPVAAARLSESIEAERDLLLTLIEDM